MDTPNGISYRPYAGESDLPAIMTLVQDALSEPYVIYTYRYFLSSWPTILRRAIPWERYLARHLVKLSIDAMIANGADEVTLETEFDNTAALALYSALGFLREKRLFRFYMNGKDAFRLVRPLRPIGGGTVSSTEVAETGTSSGRAGEAWDGEWRGGAYVFAPLSPTPASAPLALLYT
ncbi:N-alpha-acetyltransferase mak3 [Ceratobasidium sp. 414]|nr:N-alpha-acetyltransferase mak3 [Ceratobasidium sp. 414]